MTVTHPMPVTDDPALLNVDACAALLGMAPRTLRAWVDDEAFPLTIIRIGAGRGRLRFSRAQVARYLDGQEV